MMRVTRERQMEVIPTEKTPMVVTDPKMELYKTSKKHWKKEGIFSLWSIRSIPWDVIHLNRV